MINTKKISPTISLYCYDSYYTVWQLESLKLHLPALSLIRISAFVGSSRTLGFFEGNKVPKKCSSFSSISSSLRVMTID